ncbi:hypothetical protein [Maribacter sp. MJ134]|uniref:hypothetical protein n=1 Tax=Maribacter sp. MJ134 TaxID=2496865 RepID=UPI0013DF50AF|nr:hypothetical protein [Maribacter sp. MJ134]
MKEYLKLTDKYFGAIFCLLFAVGCFYMHFDKPKLNSKTDLINVTGIVQNYSFIDNSGWRSDGKRYIFKFMDYENDFQISANHINLFDKSRFEQIVNSGHKLSIEILKEQRELLNEQNERILAISISDSKNDYLKSRDVILREQGPSSMIAGFGFIVAGFLAYIVKRKNLT